MALTKPAVTEQRPDIYLPDPPDDQEKYKYFGKRRRWVFAWLLIASLGVLYGYIHVAQHAWLIAPLMWLLLMVMVPPVVVNFWLRMGPSRLTVAEHQTAVASYREVQHDETVDVFLPSCGEPLAVLDNTLRYVSLMTWGGPKTVYVLDDSARDDVRDLADKYGFRYVVRPEPGKMKKAGNLTHALSCQFRRLHRGHRRRFRGTARVPLRDHAVLRRPEGRHRPDRAVLRRQQSLILVHPALRGNAAGDLLPVHPAGPRPLRGGHLRGHEPGLPPGGRHGRGRLRLGAHRRGRPLRSEAGVGRIRDPLPASVPGQGCSASRLPVPGQSAGALVPFLDAADDREAFPGSSSSPGSNELLSGPPSFTTCHQPRCCSPGRSRR